MKKPTKFVLSVTVRYSDDSGQVLERTFNSNESETYQDFMSRMSEIYEQIRFTFGEKAFDEMYAEVDSDITTENTTEPK